MVKKHVKTTKEKKGGIISKESFIHLSNLKLIDEKAVKIARGKKVRVSGFKKAIITLKKGQSIDLTTGI